MKKQKSQKLQIIFSIIALQILSCSIILSACGEEDAMAGNTFEQISQEEAKE